MAISSLPSAEIIELFSRDDATSWTIEERTKIVEYLRAERARWASAKKSAAGASASASAGAKTKSTKGTKGTSIADIDISDLIL
jgi:hypothetical protein